ncbi:hypothetical protein NDU88_005805 [Pleurodeles waltl]|uniref:Uncharacterized protein n=1 Tax=Pleurodeles waltl TaxID=8319 RepID=A0AAV7MZH3_PLEWA|nr:hypothetical protein NDU88_005805 [Pleurodeles waltl]
MVPGSCIKRLQLRSVGFDTRYRVLAKRRYGLLKNREVLMKSRGTPRMKHVLTDYRTDIFCIKRLQLRSVGFDTRYRVLAKRRYGLLKNREVLMKSRGTPRMKHVLTDYRTDILYVDNFESD